MRKDAQPQIKSDNTETPAREHMQKLWDDMWDKIQKEPSKDDDAWKRAVETAKRDNPRELLDGQRFQGQGE